MSTRIFQEYQIHTLPATSYFPFAVLSNRCYFSSMKSRLIKLVVTVPLSHADTVREAIGKAGGGQIGNYSFCSFSSHGTGRFLPNEKANPAIGKIGQLESVEEERIEITCSRDVLQDVIIAIKKVHPYEEVTIDVYALENS